jgi:E3 ubiquitin-protein ligase RFWD3
VYKFVTIIILTETMDDFVLVANAENEEEEEESNDEESESEEEEEEELPIPPSPRVSIRTASSQVNKSPPCKANQESEEDDVEDEMNRGEIDGLFCPICIEAWSTQGEHKMWYIFTGPIPYLFC